jgi:hypothetical protein
MTGIPPNRLREMIQRFVDGHDRSLALAGEIEVALDEELGDREPFASVALALASYRPEGGPFLYGEADIVPMLQKVLDALEREAV